MRKLRRLIVLLAIAQPASAATLVNQPPTWPASRDSKTSQYSDPFNIQTFDNFAVEEGGEVRSVRWQGLYVSSSAQPQPAPMPTATHFFVGFYADNSGFPGPFMTGRYYDMTEVRQTFLAESPIVVTGGPTTTAAMYNYEASIDEFVAAPGTPYWLLMQAATPDFSAFWAWTSGDGGDGFSFQNNSGTPNPFATDRAFALSDFAPYAAGDFDEDGDVDADDLSLFEVGHGLTPLAAHEDGDATFEGDVDGADALVWQRQFAEPQLAAVPEPAGVPARILSLALIVVRRRTYITIA